MSDALKSNNFLNEILIYPKAFKPEQCELIYNSQYLRQPNINNASTDSYAHAKRYILIENEKTHWLKKKIMRYVEIANQDYYKFDISHLDNLQLLEYTENCFFDWHIDIAGKNDLNSTRKINTLIFLSNQNDYEGGQLTFNLSKDTNMPEINQEQGTLVLFPSHLAHKVDKVISGIRYSLSSIVMGNTFH